ncbi:hypothetical protein [uncultured Roseibium sp.]|uniref:hypothetical protein n=1 Tax=uncultured Roseibium sp. TaxID=1936171 RepID=UPI00260342AE|nr:hypothetical protein [uncultured Roseibium sp.]
MIQQLKFRSSNCTRIFSPLLVTIIFIIAVTVSDKAKSDSNNSVTEGYCKKLAERSRGKLIPQDRKEDDKYNYGPMQAIFKDNIIVEKKDGKLTPKNVRDILRQIDRRDPGESEIQWVKRLLRNQTHYDEFKGTEGVLYNIWLNAALQYMPTDSKGNFQSPIFIDPNGKINDKFVNRKGKEVKGYVYRRSNGSGRIVTTMCINIRTSLAANSPAGYMRFEVAIRVKKYGFEVYERDDSNPKNLFPGSEIPIKAPLADEWKYKLEAIISRRDPSHEYLKIISIWADEQRFETDFPTEDELREGIDWVDWTNDTDYEHYFTLGKDACIDILFKQKPKKTIDELKYRPDYCMGRCTDPTIINSGL